MRTVRAVRLVSSDGDGDRCDDHGDGSNDSDGADCCSCTTSC